MSQGVSARSLEGTPGWVGPYGGSHWFCTRARGLGSRLLRSNTRGNDSIAQLPHIPLFWRACGWRDIVAANGRAGDEKAQIQDHTLL